MARMLAYPVYLAGLATFKLFAAVAPYVIPVAFVGMLGTFFWWFYMGVSRELEDE